MRLLSIDQTSPAYALGLQYVVNKTVSVMKIKNMVNAASSFAAVNLAMVAFHGTVDAAARGQCHSPNVVFILIDDLGWRDVGCFGSDFYETPNIDRLSAAGVSFSSAYASCHVSSPSRASLLTGQYPATVGVTDWLPGRREYPFQRLSTTVVPQDLPHECYTLAEAFRDNGYVTACIGKWHLGETGSLPQEHGFDTHIPNGYLRGWPDTYYAPFNMNGYNGDEGDYLTDKMTDEAVAFIESNKDSPFFMLLSHFAVHDPIEGRADLVRKYTEKLAGMQKPELEPYVLEGNPDDPNALSHDELMEYLKNPVYAQNHRILPKDIVKIKQIQDNVHFAAMVESVDESVGRIMSVLEKSGIAENTIVVFFSDNGGMSAANYGNPNRVCNKDDLNAAYSTAVYPLRGGKGWMYEGGLRVPLIVCWKGHCTEGHIVRTPVVTPDLYPSLVSMAGIEMKETVAFDGVDISPLLNKEKIKGRPIYWHFPHYSNHAMIPPCGAVRDGDWKLIEYYENGKIQLFNLENDPYEMNDVSGLYPAMTDSLGGLLETWRVDIGARMPKKNITYDEIIDRDRYDYAVSDRFWPCRLANYNYIRHYHDFSEICREAMMLKTDVDSKLFEAISEVGVYKRTADDVFYRRAVSLWRELKDKSMGAICGNDERVYMWNLLVTKLYDLTGNGHFIECLLPAVNRSSDYGIAHHNMMYSHIAGEFDNNLLIVPMADAVIEPGAKFGGGKISVSVQDGEIYISLDEYTEPHTYGIFGIEIYVGTMERIDRVCLNGVSADVEVNNRGFASVVSEWRQGDKISVMLAE